MDIIYRMNVCTKEANNNNKPNWDKSESESIDTLLKELRSIIDVCNKNSEIYFSSAYINSARKIRSLDNKKK